MTYLKTALIVIIILLSGCASEQELSYAYQAQAAIVEAQASVKEVDTLTVDCSRGCGAAVIRYLDPRDRKQITVPKIRGTNDAIVEVAPSATKIVTWTVGAFAATRIVDDVMANIGGGNTTTHNTTTVSGDDNVTTGTTDLTKSNSSVGDSMSDNSLINNSDNSDSSDNSVIDSHDSVSEPTIVTQPEPIIVDQPDPIIVTQPDPIIVTETTQVVEPSIVNPVVVRP